MKDKFIRNLLVIITIELGGILAILVVIANKAEEIKYSTQTIEMNTERQIKRDIQKQEDEAEKHPLRNLFK